MSQPTTTSTSITPLLAAWARSTPCVHLPGSEEYAAAVTPWNLAVVPQPLAVVVAEHAGDVVAAVNFARRHRIRVSVQSTGHGASEALDGTLLVSTRRMTGLVVHPEERWARIGAGVTWDAVLAAGAPYGLAGLCGSAPGAGVVGYTTGGGHGPFARTLGLAADTVRAFEVVTGDGELRRVTRDQHPDLFWGLRGGKGVLGVVTAVELGLLPVPEVYAGAVYFGGDDAAAVLQAWAAWAPGLSTRGTTSVALLRLPDLPGVPPPLAGRLTVAVRFAWVGDPDAGAQALAPVRAAAMPLVDTVGVMPYAAMGAIHADPVDPMPASEVHLRLDELPRSAVDALLDVAGPGTACPMVVVEVRQLGGALAEGPDSAFDHREAAWSLFAVGPGVPPVVGAVEACAAQLQRAMAPWDPGTRLPNFGPPTTGEAARRVWTTATRDRLRRTSRAYDPAGTIAAAAVLAEG